MITGFNTDIEFNKIIYHVQTEDKGLDTPLILSLVYDRGTILASKRSPYDDLIETGFDEKVLAVRLQKQHNLICAAVRAGRIEDLKRMTIKAANSRQIVADVNKLNKNEIVPINIDLKLPAIINISKSIVKEVETTFPPQIQQPKMSWQESLNIDDDMIFKNVVIIDDEAVLPDEAVAIISDFINPDEIFETKDLSIELLNESGFKGGERKTLSIFVSNGEPIAKASVLVKILGSSFRPVIFHAKTDTNGIAIIHAQLPHFKTGRAAILFKASNGGDEVELRRIITQS